MLLLHYLYDYSLLLNHHCVSDLCGVSLEEGLHGSVKPDPPCSHQLSRNHVPPTQGTALHPPCSATLLISVTTQLCSAVCPSLQLINRVFPAVSLIVVLIFQLHY
uniref:Uncharacterized protein n=1 Tax=Otus sunia TaxID=257818 RepID=A0A8C8BFL6_9STRI